MLRKNVIQISSNTPSLLHCGMRGSPIPDCYAAAVSFCYRCPHNMTTMVAGVVARAPIGPRTSRSIVLRATNKQAAPLLHMHNTRITTVLSAHYIFSQIDDFHFFLLLFFFKSDMVVNLLEPGGSGWREEMHGLYIGLFFSSFLINDIIASILRMLPLAKTDCAIPHSISPPPPAILRIIKISTYQLSSCAVVKKSGQST